MKGDSEVILMIAFFFIGLLIGNEISNDIFKTILEASAALAAAFFGAHYAFKLQNEKNKEENDFRDTQAANRAIFELIRTHNKFLAIEKQFIIPHINNPSRHLLIMPAVGITVTPTQINYDSLAFLFPSNKPNILGTLSSVEQEICSTIEVIEKRSNFHYDNVQPVIENLEKIYGTHIPANEIEKALGTRFSKILSDSTDFMIEGVAAVIEGTRNHIELLHSQTIEIYPGHKIIKMDLTSF